MAQFNQAQIKQTIHENLEEMEQLISIGVFKKVPSTSWLLLSRGMAWILASKFYVGVTDRRLIILPESMQRGATGIFAGFDEVDFYTDPLNNTILDIHKTYQGEPLKLRFKSGYTFEGMDQFDFITAVKQGKRATVGKENPNS
jgi:hypothetical protein